MAITKEELAQLKQEFEALNEKLKTLSGDELEQVTGGFIPPLPIGADFRTVDEHIGVEPGEGVTAKPRPKIVP